MADDDEQDVETTNDDDLDPEAPLSSEPPQEPSDAAPDDGPVPDADGSESRTGVNVADDTPETDDEGFSPHHNEGYRNTVRHYRDTRSQCPACGTADGIQQGSVVCDSCGANFDESPNPA